MRESSGGLPRATAAREAYAQTVGEDGFLLRDALDTPDAPEGLRALPSLDALPGRGSVITSERRVRQRLLERPPRLRYVSRRVGNCHRLLQPATHSGAEAGRSVRSPWPYATRHRHYLVVARHACLRVWLGRRDRDQGARVPHLW